MNDYSLEDIVRCVHSTRGRLRFRLVASAIDMYKNFGAEQKEDLLEKQKAMLEKIEKMQGITAVRINTIIATITITYNPQVTTEANVVSSLNSIVKEYYPGNAGDKAEK
jgi:allophanate hydrolase subunit 1